MRFILLALAMGFVGASASWAQPVKLSLPTQDYNYFNKPGADMAAHDRDVAACAARAVDLAPVGYRSNQGLVGDLVNAAPVRAVLWSAIENCMIVRGWRVAVLTESVGAALARLPQPELAQKLAGWVGAGAPEGRIARVWGNEAADAVNDRYEMRPTAPSGSALSIKALGPLQLRAAKPRPKPKRLFSIISPDEVLAAPKDKAVIILRMRGNSPRNGVAFSFARMGASADDWRPSATDGEVDMVTANLSVFSIKKEGNWKAFVVPPGRWRLDSMDFLSFCFGSPAFDVKAGEVLYLGTFDFGAPDFTPDVSLAPVQEWAGPEVSSVLKVAVYTNGWEDRCEGSGGAYAVEFTGATFR